MEEWPFVDEQELQEWKGACICITCQPLHLRRRPALPHACCVLNSAAPVTAGRPPDEGVQALGTNLAEGARVGS